MCQTVHTNNKFAIKPLEYKLDSMSASDSRHICIHIVLLEEHATMYYLVLMEETHFTALIHFYGKESCSHLLRGGGARGVAKWEGEYELLNGYCLEGRDEYTEWE